MQNLIDKISEDVQKYLSHSDIQVRFRGVSKRFGNIVFHFSNRNDKFSISISMKTEEFFFKETKHFYIVISSPHKSLVCDNVANFIHDRLNLYEEKISESNVRLLHKYFPSEPLDEDQLNSEILLITTACNLDCCFCRGKNVIDNKQILNYEEIKKNLIEIRKKSKSLSLSGGEPTLHPQLVDIVKFAKKIGFKTISLHTNGVNLANKSYLYELIDSGITNIIMTMVSLDFKTSKSMYGINVVAKQLLALENINNLRTRISLTLKTLLSSLNNNEILNIIDFFVIQNPDVIQIHYALDKPNSDDTYYIANIDELNLNHLINRMMKKQLSDISLKFEYFPKCKVPNNYRDNVEISALERTNLGQINLKDYAIVNSERKPNECKKCIYYNACDFPVLIHQHKYPNVKFEPILK